jgi:hypothetical protein
MDDFSWGATRLVTGETTQHDHSKREGDFDPSQIPFLYLPDWMQLLRRSTSSSTLTLAPADAAKAIVPAAVGIGHGAEGQPQPLLSVPVSRDKKLRRRSRPDAS